MPSPEDIETSSAPRLIPASLIIIIGMVLLCVDGGTRATTLLPATLLLLAGAIWSNRSEFKPSRPGLILAAFAALALLTVLPLPDTLLKLAGKEAASHHVMARTALREAADHGFVREAGFFQISRNYAGTMRSILWLTLALSCGALIRKVPTEKAERLLLTIGALSALIGIAGLISLHLHTQHKTFWWLLSVDHGRPVACFVNRNHFGGFMGVVSVVMLSMACVTFRQKRFITICSAAAFLVCATSAVGSMSRGAVLSLCVGIITALALHIRKRAVPVTLLILLLGACVFAGLLFGDKEGKIRSRISSISNPMKTTSARLRLETWKASIPITAHYPIFGTGLNGFRAVFPQHRSSATRKEPEHVENEYIQLPVETGLLGSALLLTALFFFIKPMSNASGRTDLLTVAIPGLAVAAAHALIDFAVRVPLYGLLIAILAGLCISKRHIADSHRAGRFALVCFLPVALTALILTCMRPNSTFKFDSYDYLNQASMKQLPDILEASPSSWHAYYNLGRSAAYRPELRVLAEQNITRAAALDPLNYRLMIELARLRLDMNMTESATEAYRQAKALRSWLKIPELEQHIR